MSDSSVKVVAAVPAAKKGLAGAAVSGATWTLVGFGLGNIIRLAGNMVLARFVDAEAFGIMALVNVTIQGLHMMSDVGIGTAIVQHKRGGDETFLRTAWTMAIIRSFVIAAVGCMLAYPIASFYANPILAPLIICSSLAMLLHGTMSTSLYVASRDLKVSRVILIELIMAMVTTLTMVGSAAMYPAIASGFWGLSQNAWLPEMVRRFVAESLTNPVWSLLWGTIVASIFRLVLSFTIIPSIKHRLCWDAESRKELFRFGRWIMLGTLLTFLTGQLDRFMIPKLLNSLSVFGLYAIALNFASLPMDVLQRIGTQVLFPVYSRLARENRFSSEVYVRVSFIILTLGALAVAGLVAIAPGFIQTFYQAKYHDVALILQAVAAVVWLRVLQYNSGSALLALGDSKVQATSNGVKLVAMFAFVIAGFYLAQRISTAPLAGLFGAIAGIAVSELGKYFVLACAFAKGDWRRLKPDLKATVELAVACAIVIGVHAMTRQLPHWLDMVLSGSVVLILYAAVMYRALLLVGPHLPMKLPGPLARFQRVAPAGAAQIGGSA